jgi:uncharacterized protein (DUF58 family)
MWRMPPVERCPRCGTPRRGDLQVCVRCETPFSAAESSDAADALDAALPRPAAPSPTQSHGTLMALLLLGFVILAVLLWLSVRDVGPFRGTVVSTEKVGNVARVTVSISNEGGKPGHGKCRIERLSDTNDAQPPHQFLSQRVPANGTVTETVEVQLLPGHRTGQVVC